MRENMVRKCPVILAMILNPFTLETMHMGILFMSEKYFENQLNVIVYI